MSSVCLVCTDPSHSPLQVSHPVCSEETWCYDQVCCLVCTDPSHPSLQISHPVCSNWKWAKRMATKGNCTDLIFLGPIYPFF